MKAVIFSHLFDRGETIFKQSGIDFIICRERDEKKFLDLQHQHQAGAVVLDSRPFSEEFFRAFLPRTLIVRFGTGIDNIPVKTCKECGHLIANTPGASASSVTEYVFTVLAALSQGIWTGHQQVISREWSRPTGQEICGKRLAVLGLGRIGRLVAETAVSRYGMRVIGFCRKNRIPDKSEIMNQPGINRVELTDSLHEAVKGADFVSIHLSLNPETEFIINRETLGLFEKKALLVNTARGRHIREIDLRRALDERVIAGAALDVFEREPYAPAPMPALKEDIPELTSLPHVILTPHIAGHTEEANRNTAIMVIENIRAFSENRLQEAYLINGDN